MLYRTLGRSGLKVSPICLGTTMFGSDVEVATARAMIERARAAGVNFLDTADVYGNGASERTVGSLIAADRDAWVLATKVGSPVGAGPNERGLSRRHIVMAAEASLTRLGTDRIDIYYLHREDPATPLSEVVSAIADLIHQGKILHFGVSNHKAWRIAELCHLCDRLGLARPIVSQPPYNALNRMAEVEQLPACAHLGLGVVPYSPLARGVLTGKYRPDEPPPHDTRAGRQDVRMLQTEWRPESLRIAQEIRRHAESRGITAGQFAINWILNNRAVSAVVAGPRTVEQWDDYVDALSYRFTVEDEALINRLVAPGHASTPGYNDPQYPIEGRMTLTSSENSAEAERKSA